MSPDVFQMLAFQFELFLMADTTPSMQEINMRRGKDSPIPLFSSTQQKWEEVDGKTNFLILDGAHLCLDAGMYF